MSGNGRFLTRAGLISAILVVAAACATLQNVLNREQIEIAYDSARAEELELVRSTIAGRERIDAFIALLQERDELLDSYARGVAVHREKLAGLTADYDASRADFDALLEEFNRRREAGQRELVELIYRMKQATTAGEWETIAAFQTENLDLRRLASPGATEES